MRPDWDKYFLQIAHVVALRSTCNRKQVGAVLVRDRFILATGYGGSVRGQPHCIDVGCAKGPDGGCTRTVHAEMNALAQAARHGVNISGSTLYVTLSPCVWCLKTIINAGVVRIVFSEEYRIPVDRSFTDSCGVEVVCLEE